MKKIFLGLLAATVLWSCNFLNKGYQDSESFKELKEELIKKFGKDAYYTSFTIANDKNATIVSVTETDNPSSLKMAEWMKLNGVWKQNADVTLEVSEGSKAEDFMFQLDKTMNMELLGKLVDEAKQKVISEKNIKEVNVKMVSFSAPDDGDFSHAQYYIIIEPKQGGTDFKFSYNLDGTLAKFDY
ncbi:hypothetical protein [Riemerella columbipharyngis]|uniref:Uncharacterized protein n=1 Tax=Riemerella columbipharyngis TaxID=1071918 RepID=A0A1G6Y5N6_9FLAO|nr:hypothetical protein [Riemerella columbipharyngis]SDD85293.1 hypothetical protein SAMN05421544_10127 [Riemerella columbipharyngis]